MRDGCWRGIVAPARGSWLGPAFLFFSRATKGRWDILSPNISLNSQPVSELAPPDKSHHDIGAPKSIVSSFFPLTASAAADPVDNSQLASSRPLFSPAWTQATTTTTADLVYLVTARRSWTVSTRGIFGNIHACGPAGRDGIDGEMGRST